MTRARWATALAAVMVLLAGCTGAPPVTRDPSGSTPTSSSARTGSAPAPPPTDDLAAAKTAAGIADCPVTDPATEARPDGLPELTLSCLGGGAEVNLAGLRDGPYVINIWAQWCAPCRQEAPFLREVAEARAGQVAFLGIDYADPEPGRAIAFAAEAGWRYPQLADVDETVRAPVQLIGPPLTLLVDGDGRIVHRHPGAFGSAAELDALLVEHLGVTA